MTSECVSVQYGRLLYTVARFYELELPHWSIGPHVGVCLRHRLLVEAVTKSRDDDAFALRLVTGRRGRALHGKNVRPVSHRRC